MLFHPTKKKIQGQVGYMLSLSIKKTDKYQEQVIKLMAISFAEEAMKFINNVLINCLFLFH